MQTLILYRNGYLNLSALESNPLSAERMGSILRLFETNKNLLIPSVFFVVLVETFLISLVFIDHSELCGLGDLIKNLFELEPISLDDLGVPYARAKAT